MTDETRTTRTRHQLREAEIPAAREQFLEYLRQGYPVSTAAALARCGRVTVYGWRQNDPEFAKAWDDAYAAGGDAIEEEARRRAIDGWDEAVFQGGEQVGVVHRFSDRLLERLLKGRKPQVYGELVSITNQIQTEPVEIRVVYVDQRPLHTTTHVRVVHETESEHAANTTASESPTLPALAREARDLERDHDD
jgi:hypothetical protein